MVHVSMFKKGTENSVDLLDSRERSVVPREGEIINVDHGELYKVVSVSHDWVDDFVQILVEDE